MPYVTVADVDAELAAGWEGSGDKAASVKMANMWLTSRSIPSGVEDERITLAGAYLAKMAAAGTLYADSEGAVKSERVKADTVEVDTTYQDGSKAIIGDMAYVKDLLRPWLNPYGSSVRILSRL